MPQPLRRNDRDGDGALHRTLELLAPSAGGSFTHWWRDNSSGSLPWSKAETMANDVASLLTHTGTTYNRNFETIYRRSGGQLRHWYFDQASGKWYQGPIFGPGNAVGEVGFAKATTGREISKSSSLCRTAKSNTGGAAGNWKIAVASPGRVFSPSGLRSLKAHGTTSSSSQRWPTARCNTGGAMVPTGLVISFSAPASRRPPA